MIYVSVIVVNKWLEDIETTRHGVEDLLNSKKRVCLHLAQQKYLTQLEQVKERGVESD